MRIVAGEWGGRRIAAPPGDAVRPTSDRVREALFSILGDAVPGARVLDLFAGSGALGLEALSRGAAQATFVDRSPAAIRAVRENLARLGAEAEVVRAEATAWVRRASGQYDLAFLDPPYREATALVPALGEHLAGVLAPGARVVAESGRRAPLDLPLLLLDERRYGDTLIRIFRP